MLREDQLVIVDTQYDRTAESTITTFEDHRGNAADPLFNLLINTHHHGDHTGGNAAMMPHAGRSVAHEACVRLQNASSDADDAAIAETTFADEWSTDVADETVSLHHDGPAHTGGDATIFFERANIVHTGDLVFNRVVPFIDVDGGAHVENWISTLETLHDRYDDDTQFIFGHGHPDHGIIGSRAGLLQMRDYLTALSEFVQAKRAEGVDLGTLKKETNLPGFEEYSSDDWPLPLAQNLEAVYREQMGNTPATSS
ncbi:MBL fold metallo-hydrolase [Longibacter salinarum]|nr:MBL fold metallo-hydrolase [Longibacter salinarum]